EILIARKRKDVPNATSLQAWDTNFYSELVRAENFDFDAKLLRPYFAFGKVLEGLFEITRELFGVRYERVSGVPVWHPSVDVYDVVDGDRRIGRFYLDLHPRKDKYTHAAASILVRGSAGLSLPQAALMCNFGHLHGYSALDYTYKWSLVLDKDRFPKDQGGDTILDPKVARRYRETLLAAGSRRPASQLIEDFLGRPLPFDAFESWLSP